MKEQRGELLRRPRTGSRFSELRGLYSRVTHMKGIGEQGMRGDGEREVSGDGDEGRGAARQAERRSGAT
jgi:hypothetical protein